ncbi:MAG: 50S ribosomal protein L21 [Patescibacteria group bacterium]|nr:50S ribosomal protein L21 [Patescibacteria group bacterium]MDE2588177.1 50S ribosomal protein L21 [Patescibacteria group bacterium]
MKYAVISVGGKQYKVSEGDVLELESLGAKANDAYTFDTVLLVVDEKTRKIGTPSVSGATVSATVVDTKKGPKIRVAKYKAKVRYRKVIGFRPTVTTVKVDKINVK